MTMMLQRVSSSCYKQLHDGGFMILPNSEHFRLSLSSAINIDTLKWSASTIAYLKARFRKFKDHDKLVCILMDEVYSQTMAQFVNGRIYGAENGSFTKTLLSVMMKSISGHHCDDTFSKHQCKYNFQNMGPSFGGCHRNRFRCCCYND